MIPRLWFVCDSEARRLIDREPFRSTLKGLPETDRVAVARLAVEAYRRERLTVVGTKRPMSKCVENAVRNYQQWRAERPDDYQLWLDAIHGGARREAPAIEDTPRWTLIDNGDQVEMAVE